MYCLNADTDEWTQLSNMPNRRGNLSTVLFNNRIWVIGGNFNNSRKIMWIVYDPQTDSWLTEPSMNLAREGLVTWFGW